VAWPDFARPAAKTGFPGADVNLTGAMKQGAGATRALLAELNLKPAVVGLPVDFRKDQATFEKDPAQLSLAADVAAAIGCPRMSTRVMSSSERTKAEERRVLKDRFSRCAEIPVRSNIRLGLEFLAFAKECGGNVGLPLDSWHWHHAGGTLKDIEAAGKHNIVHAQVADAPKLPPEGASLEIFGRGLKDMTPEEGARLGLSTPTAVMKKAGVL